MANHARRSRLAVAAAALLVTGLYGQPAPAAAQEPSMDQAEQEIRAAQERWMDAAIHKDESRLRQILGEEFRLINGQLGFVDRDGWLGMGSDYTIENFEYLESDIRVYGNTAVSNSRYRQEATDNREDRSAIFDLTDVWVRRDGRWQVVTRHSSIARSP